MKAFSKRQIIDVNKTTQLRLNFFLPLLCFLLLFTNVNGEKIDNLTTIPTEEIPIDPVAICQDFSTQLDFSGTKAISPFNVNGGSFDPDGNIIDFSVDPDFFTCDDLGVNVVTLTVEDNDGNTATCTANVTVSFPGQTMSCVSQLNLSLGYDGTGTLEPGDILYGAYIDPCDLFTVTPSYFTCADVGQEFVVQVADGASGNFCWSTVLIEDKIPPTPICYSSLSISLDIDGNAYITPDMVDAGSYDNCSQLTFELSDSTFNCTNIGNNNVVSMTVTDVGGNTSQCFTIVNVEDNTAPEFIYPEDINLECNGNTDPSITGEPIIIDNCGTYGMSYNDQVFNLPGNTIKILREWTIIDWLTGDVEIYIQIIKTVDTQAPTAICAANVNVALDQFGMATLPPEAIDAGSFDDCGDVTFSISPNTFDCSDVGQNFTVVLTVYDESGNSNQCWSNVLIEDKQGPTAVCNAQVNVSLGADGTATITPDVIDAGSYDNCGPLTYELSQSTFDCADILNDSLVVILTVTDASGNTNQCWAEIVVEDKLAPNVTCPADITLDCSQGDNLDPLITGTPFVVDNCDLIGYAYEDLILPTCGGAFKVLRTWTIVDWYSGSIQECIQVIKVVDFTPPDLVCLNQLTAALDFSGSLTLYPEDLILSATDDCDSVSYTTTEYQFDCSDIGYTTLIVEAVDGCGNISQCQVGVTIEDKTSPTAVCNAQVNVSLGANGMATITPAVIDAGSYDECGPVTLALDQTSFDCSDIGDSIVVILTVTDASGNTNQCWSEIIVEDKLAPTVTCPPDLTLDCSLADDLDPLLTGSPTVVDNCNQIGYSYEDLILSLGGSNIKVLRTWTVIDWNSGAIQECIQVMTLLDVTPPDILCLNGLTASLDANGNLTLFPGDLDAGTTDDCGDVTLTIDKSEFDCSDVGISQVTLTATDDNGNISQCIVNVTIQGLDSDGDGFSICENDCNENDNTIYPGAPEVCGDNIDNNCNGEVDEECICPSYGGSTQYEWIESIAVNGIANTSGDDGGYGDYTGVILEVAHGNNSVQLTPGFSGNKRKEYWSIWIDFNHNFIFDPDEEIFNDNSKNTINGSINIPATALQGNTTMRIAMKFNQYSDPCEIFPNGEVEDYTVNISTPSYCQPGGQSTQFEWIKKVQIKSINNTSGDDGGYADYTGLNTSLNPGQSKNIKLQPGFSGSSNVEYWRVWVDWNEDGDFDDAGELEVETSSSSNVTDQITVPNNASGGNKIMRVSMKNGGYADPCELFTNGEVEDYTIIVTGSNPLANNNATFDFIALDVTQSQINLDQTSTTRFIGSELEVRLFPNPTSNLINIEINASEKKGIKLTMFNKVGQTVYQTISDQNNIIIDVTKDQFTNGIYMILIQQGEQVISKRVIISK
jgi:hypothetical protein